MTNEQQVRPRPSLKIRVECIVGAYGDKVPKSLHLGSRVIHCLELIDQWHGRDHRYFKIRAEEGEVYILRYDVHSLEWELTLFSSEQYLTGKSEMDHPFNRLSHMS